MVITSIFLAATLQTEPAHTNEMRRLYNIECRQQLHIEPQEIVQPGPKLGMFLRCIERKTSTARRQKNLIHRRTIAEEKKKDISNTLLQEQQEKTSKELRARNTLRQRRLGTKRYFSVSPRVRTRIDLKKAFREGSTAEKKHNAQTCRRKKPSEWASCIRNALQ